MDIDSMKVYQPKTEVMADSNGVIIEQTDETGETVYVMIDKLFLPILIKWLKTVNDNLNCARD